MKRKRNELFKIDHIYLETPFNALNRSQNGAVYGLYSSWVIFAKLHSQFTLIGDQCGH